MQTFANILFAGPCNARCPCCIGRQVDPRLSQDNLCLYPPRNLKRFVERITQKAVRQVVFTGSTTDPQLYPYEACLLIEMRRTLHPDTRFALHTNGRLALRKMDTLNLYDRVCISFPSFDPVTYRIMMGVPHPPDLAEILRLARPPVKVSCLVDTPNLPEMEEYLQRCRESGVRRVVLRKLYGDLRSWDALLSTVDLGLKQRGTYYANPVYDLDGMEVTLWDFALSECRSINLFGNGVISEAYLLAQANGADQEMEPRI